MDQLSLLYVANWKMNMDLEQAVKFFTSCKELVLANDYLEDNIIICPTFPQIPIASMELEDMAISIGAQNCSEFAQGAYTGEVSASSLADIGCMFCIVGHSERRIIFKESNDTIAKKVVQLLNQEIDPIICIGETEQEFNDKKTFSVLEAQLRPIFQAIKVSQLKPEELFIAYEPVWAIGTGKTPDNDYIENIFDWIEDFKEKQLGNTIDSVLLYGGSVDPITAPMLKDISNLGGFLIGGASTDFQKFKKIVTLE